MPTIDIPEKIILDAIKEKLDIKDTVRYRFFRDKLGRQRLRIWC